MPDDVKISEMSEAASLDNSAQFPYVQSMNGTLTTLKAPLSQIGTKLNEGMTFSNLQTTSKNIVGAINEAAQGGGVEYATELPISSTDPTNTKAYIDTKTTLVKSASGSLVHITDGADNIPMKSLESEIVAVESGSGTKSPTNPYTISGFDSGVITRCGKNLVDTSLCTNRTASGVASTLNSNGSINLNGTASATARWWHANDDMSILLKAGTYTTSTNISGVGLTLFTSEGYKSGTFTLTSDMLVTNLIFELEIGRNYNVDVLPQLEVGNQATTYEAYNGTTYTFTFGQTVYGGHFDNKGNLVVTHSGVKISDNVWSYDPSFKYFSTTISALKINTDVNSVLEGLDCEVYTNRTPRQAGSGDVNNSIAGFNDTIRIKDLAYDNTTDFVNATGDYLIKYPLENPITLTIASQDIPTLSGENNIFSNCGDLDIEYCTERADEIVDLIKASTWTEITGTLTAGNTSITLSSGAITSNSTINVFTDGGVDYTSITVTNGSVTLTFDERSSDLSVKVRVS